MLIQYALQRAVDNNQTLTRTKMKLAAQDITNDVDKKPRLRAVMRQNNSGSLYVFLKIKKADLTAPKRGK